MQYMTALKGHKVKFIGNRKMAEMPSPVSSWSLAGQYGVRVIVTVMLSREGNDSVHFGSDTKSGFEHIMMRFQLNDWR